MDLGTKSLWFDEAFSVFIANQSLSDIPRLVWTYDTHPPLYYVLLHLWMAMFGSGEIAVRSLSVVVSLAVIFLTFLLARRLAGERIAILAAALLAFSPFQVMAAQEARMYPLLALFTIASSYALYLALDEGRRTHWIAYGVTALLGLYTHHFAFLVLATHGVYIFLVIRSPAARRAWVIVLALVAVGYAPMVQGFIAEFKSARGWPDIRPPFGIRPLTNTLAMLSFGGGLFGMGDYFQRGFLPFQYQPIILLPFAMLLAAGAAGLDHGNKRLFLVLNWLLPIAVLALISVKWNLYYERYFSFLLSPFIILLAGGIFYVADSIGDGRKRKAVLVGVLALIASFYIPVLNNVYQTTSNYNWRGAAQHVTKNVASDDFILFVPAFARLPFEYYFVGDQAREGINPREFTGKGTAQTDPKVLARSLARLSRQHPRMWLVATVPIGFEARQRLMKHLSPYFREVDGKDFGRVYIFLWRSKVYQQQERRL